MAMLCCAYGMRLSSSFPIPGMTPLETLGDGLPALSLDLASPAELELTWRSTSEEPQWRGRLGDGLELTIEHGAAGDVLFSYADRARFHLNEPMDRLGCAPNSDGPDWQRVLVSKVIPSISVMRGYEALHAAAVESPAGVVAIMAPSGAGKSTLAAELLRRGWPLFADDVLVLDGQAGAVVAHPGSAHMNIAGHMPAGLEPEMLGEQLAILAGERWMTARALATGPRQVSMLCLLERGPGLQRGAEQLPAGPLLLAPYILGLSTDPERQRKRFDLYADLMESCTLVRLSAGLGDGPRETADLIERTLSGRQHSLAGSAG